MTNCPCCSNQMLRHIHGNETYWFCRHCWQEMPILNSIQRIKGFEIQSYSFKESANILQSSSLQQLSYAIQPASGKSISECGKARI